MVKVLTKAELAELAKQGTVKFDPQDTNIARFGELIEKLSALLEQNTARTQADLSRSQVQLEILGAIQKSINQQKRGVIRSQPIDLAPLQEILAQIQAATVERAEMAYSFEIQRGPNGGPMQRVIATPMVIN